jgi:K+-sensing histidine kinase KdpD
VFFENLLHSQADALSQIDQIVRSISLPLASGLDDPFQHVLRHHLTIRWSSASSMYGELPADFQRRFEVEDAWIMPLLADQDCLGLLIVDNKFNNIPIDLTDIELLSTFANLVAMAITQDRRRRAEQSRLELSETYREISRVLSSSLDIDKVLDSILEQMARVLPYNVATVQWLDERENGLRIIRAKGFPDEEIIEKLSFPLDGHFPNVEVFHKRTIIRYEDIQHEYQHFSDPRYGVKRIHSWLGVPLIVENDVKGVITVDHFEYGVYNISHESIAITLASIAAMALRNAEAAQEMVRISSIASMGAWGAELTHEMKGELANIRRKTEIIGDELEDLPPGEPLRQTIEEAIQEIEQSMDKLKFPPMPRSRQEAEQFLPEAPACADEVIRRVCDEFQEKNPEIYFGEVLECGPALARLHEMWFERILGHLLHNASRAVDKQRTPRILVRSRLTQNEIRVEVADNGHGITEEILPLLFREPAPAREDRSGQGLLIVRYLLELHGGHIQVGWNKHGQGACFYFTVPLMPGQSLPASYEPTKEHS